ncbi:ABC transporter substrate-binding protein [Metaclostridioides mangenotii]|uniref:ABC transporter substrate-binding protein n=1 Tax=Metaclostridioides mangenotii TaxID=1540 RepID=UPI0026F2D2C8|nr:ABC transporter substrate-binding protein [Clostridioides mangenotii]
MKKQKFLKSFLSVLIVTILVLGTTACSPKKSESDNNKGNGSQAQETDSKPEKTKYPLTITTYGSNGEELKTVYKKAPEKALAVYQGSIETLLALGLEDKIAAAAGLDNEVSSDLKPAFDKVKYLTEFTPSKESVTMLNPDLIFSWGSYFSDKTLGDAASLVNNGTNIYINSNTRKKDGEARTLENEFTDILNLGKIFDVQEKAHQIVDDMKSEIDKVAEKTSKIDKKPTALILEFQGNTIVNYGASSLGGDMVTKLGGKLVNEDGADLGKEDIITLNPDVIFVVYMPYSGDDAEKVKKENLDKILKEKSLASLSAVKNKRVQPIMLGDMYASGIRTKSGIVNFAEGLYPNLK